MPETPSMSAMISTRMASSLARRSVICSTVTRLATGSRVTHLIGRPFFDEGVRDSMPRARRALLCERLPVKRRLSNLLFGLSAVLCVALLIGWVASFFVIPWGVRNTRQSRIIWGAGDGHVQVICYRGPGWEQQFHDGKTPKPTVWLSFDRTTPHWETSRGLLPQHR